MNSVDWSKVDEAMGRAIESAGPSGVSPSDRGGHVFPGAVLLVGCGGEPVYFRSFGNRSIRPEVTPLDRDMVYDVASLTKPIVTATVAMQLVERGKLDIDRRLSHVFQSFGTHGKERITIRHLLSHTSGYAATAPFYKQIFQADKGARAGMMNSRGAVEAVCNEIFRSKIEHLPGKVTRYSDIGFILLGHALEVVSGMSLDKLALRYVFQPLQMRNSGFIDLAAVKRRGIKAVSEMIAPTAKCSWRNRILCGEVHDENAWAMGGIAAHAGLFTNAWDVHLFASEMIRCWHGQSEYLSQGVVRRFWKRDDTDSTSSWALGWDTPSAQRSSSGQYFSRDSVGHLGYTGCSLWVDPVRELDVVLLSNRIHSASDNREIQLFRPVLHDLIMEALNFR